LLHAKSAVASRVDELLLKFVFGPLTSPKSAELIIGVGSLRRTSFWTSEFRAESYHGSWRFRRSGSLGAGIEIIDLTSRVAIAALKPNWSGGGTLAFSDDYVTARRVTTQSTAEIQRCGYSPG
jgi:hypothetical protein